MGYLNSGSVRVFPCASRGGIYTRSARLTTEQNLVSIVNKLIDTRYFVLEGVNGVHTPASNNGYIFNIEGYIFDTTVNDILDALALTGTGTWDVYASIATTTDFDTDGVDHALTTKELITRQEESSSQWLDQEIDGSLKFTGVKLEAVSESDAAPSGAFKILEITRTDTQTICVTPPEALLKFRTNKDGRRRSVSIDDGVL